MSGKYPTSARWIRQSAERRPDRQHPLAGAGAGPVPARLPRLAPHAYSARPPHYRRHDERPAHPRFIDGSTASARAASANSGGASTRTGSGSAACSPTTEHFIAPLLASEPGLYGLGSTPRAASSRKYQCRKRMAERPPPPPPTPTICSTVTATKGAEVCHATDANGPRRNSDSVARHHRRLRRTVPGTRRSV